MLLKLNIAIQGQLFPAVSPGKRWVGVGYCPKIGGYKNEGLIPLCKLGRESGSFVSQHVFILVAF